MVVQEEPGEAGVSRFAGIAGAGEATGVAGATGGVSVGIGAPSRLPLLVFPGAFAGPFSGAVPSGTGVASGFVSAGLEVVSVLSGSVVVLSSRSFGCVGFGSSGLSEVNRAAQALIDKSRVSMLPIAIGSSICSAYA
mgnify:CR=1 FL=1